MLFHSLGVFVATFLYSLGALAWVDLVRSGIVPLFSGYVVAGLLLLSMLLFSRLMKGVSDLQITSVLGRRELDAGRARDANGVLRLIFPMPTWEDYLARI